MKKLIAVKGKSWNDRVKGLTSGHFAFGVFVASTMVACCGWAEENAADFVNGVGTNDWTVSDDEWLSPTYDSAVDKIVLQYSGTDASASATIQARTKQGAETLVATFTAASSGASFDFPDTTDFRSFRITSTNGLALSSFTAYVSASSIDTPTGVVISNNTTGTSFDAYWDPVADAKGYRVYVWTNAIAEASAGTAVWQETMPGATNTSSNTKLNDSKFNACFANPGWTRSDKAGYPTGEAGTIRIGTTGDNGWIQTPQINQSGNGMAVRFLAKAVDSRSNGKSVVVERVSGETTHSAGTATLSNEMQEFTIVLSEWESSNCIRFNSITNGDRRVVIGAVTVVSGYSEGQLEPSYIVNGLDVGTATSHSFADLPSVPVQFAVEAYGRRGVSSAKTEAVEVDLSNPDKVAMLNACPLSSLTSSANTYSQNFNQTAALTYTTGDKELLNGTTLLYWQWFKNGVDAGTFKWNSGTGTTGGFYSLSTNQSEAVRALGAYSTKDNEFSFGMAFTNDTGSAMTISSIEYVVQQWGFANTTNQTLSISVKVVDSLDWISAHDEGWTVLASTESVVYGTEASHDTPVSTPITVSPEAEVSIAPGQVLMLKWTIHSLKAGKPGMMGIDDVSVIFGNKARGLSISIAVNP